MGKIEEFYGKHYKKLMIIPIILVLTSLFIIYNFHQRTGDFINKDVSLKGGITVTINTEKDVDINELKTYLESKFPDSDISIRKLSAFGAGEVSGFIVESSKIDSDNLKVVLGEKLGIKLDQNNYSVEEIGSSLGESFYADMLKSILFAFIFMAIVVFIAYRTFIPSVAVIFSAFADMLITLAIVDLIGIKVSSAGVAAFVLLIAFSVDTDILLTTRMIKRTENTLLERMVGAMKTGVTMIASAIASLGIAFLVSNSLIFKQMFLIIIIGLVVDLFSTYLMNAGILIWYGKKKNLT